jgi:hypothetical protein
MRDGGESHCPNVPTYCIDDSLWHRYLIFLGNAGPSLLDGAQYANQLEVPADADQNAAQ